MNKSIEKEGGLPVRGPDGLLIPASGSIADGGIVGFGSVVTIDDILNYKPEFEGEKEGEDEI